TKLIVVHPPIACPVPAKVQLITIHGSHADSVIRPRLDFHAKRLETAAMPAFPYHIAAEQFDRYPPFDTLPTVSSEWRNRRGKNYQTLLIRNPCMRQTKVGQAP